jgi:hypothetical protein
MKMRGKFIGESNQLGCIFGKEYLIVGEDKELESYNVIDETGEDYLYDRNLFEITEVIAE